MDQAWPNRIPICHNWYTHPIGLGILRHAIHSRVGGFLIAVRVDELFSLAKDNTTVGNERKEEFVGIVLGREGKFRWLDSRMQRKGIGNQIK